MTNGGSGTVSVVDTATNTVKTLYRACREFSLQVAVNSAGTKVYVTNINSNNVSVIDAASNTVSATVNVSSSPYGVVVNRMGTKGICGEQ